MNTSRILTVAATLVLAGTSAFSQSLPAAGDTAATGALSPTDSCRRSTARHDHGTDRGFPAPLSSACTSGGAATAKPATRAKSGPLHDHSRFHKNQ